MHSESLLILPEPYWPHRSRLVALAPAVRFDEQQIWCGGRKAAICGSEQNHRAQTLQSDLQELITLLICERIHQNISKRTHEQQGGGGSTLGFSVWSSTDSMLEVDIDFLYFSSFFLIPRPEASTHLQISYRQTYSQTFHSVIDCNSSFCTCVAYVCHLKCDKSKKKIMTSTEFTFHIVDKTSCPALLS